MEFFQSSINSNQFQVQISKLVNVEVPVRNGKRKPEVYSNRYHSARGFLRCWPVRLCLIGRAANVWAQVPPTGISRGNSLVTYSQLSRKHKNYRRRCQNTALGVSVQKNEIISYTVFKETDKLGLPSDCIKCRKSPGRL